MVEAAKLITAIAALLSAIAWPVTLAILLFVFRKPLGQIIERTPEFLRRMRHVKFAGFEALLEAEARPLIESTVEHPEIITVQQSQSAARVAAAARSMDREDIKDQVRALSAKYDTLRRALPSGPDRTRAMTDVMVRMRALSPAIAHFLNELKRSDSGGDHLAAVAVMQMDTGTTDLDWLLKRFSEDEPFVFFHSAVALSRAAATSNGDREEVRRVILQALDTVRSFDGLPDKNTVRILSGALEN